MANLTEIVEQPAASESSSAGAGSTPLMNASLEETNAKLAQGTKFKEEADELFKKGDITGAIRQYHMSLLYIQGLNKNAVPYSGSVPSATDEKKNTEIDIILEKIYSNMCACYLKQSKWARAEETANKILAKNPDNTKASFRKAKALSSQGYTEKAIKILEDLLKKTPDDAIIKAELEQVKAADTAASKKGLNKFKGFLNRSNEKKSGVEEVTNQLEESRIEEVHDS
ncbi:hypothetical protein FRC02_003093 [Tulasnella sp. 418]|nr:hypothetical protein FRC02_003093 [Tulasnella sp. 418]